jgi:ribosomal peptide maturation radical SAM protein 1
MSKRVLLVSMPFSSTKYPSPALGILKPLVRATGTPCDVAYLNVFFQAFCGQPHVYEGVADFMIIGESVFGAELFGDEWAASERGQLKDYDAPFLPRGAVRKAVKKSLLNLRTMAGPFLDECLKILRIEDYGIIGFTSVYSQQAASLALARRIKKLWPEKIIVFGGANCQEEMGDALLRLFPFVDWVCNGEADISFPRAVRHWSEGSPPAGIDGISYRGRDGIITQGSGPSPRMEDLPYPDFDDYFAALDRWAPEDRFSAPISLEFSRGCWWGKKSQCIFCGLNCKTVDYRKKSAERAETEIKALVKQYRVDKVILTDSVIDMSLFKTVLPALSRWGGVEELFLETRAHLTRKQVGLLRSAGVKSFQPGIESLDTEMLKLMGKGTTLLHNIRFLKWAREFGLYPTWNLLCGFPGEPPEAYRRMAELVPAIAHLCPPMGVNPVLLVRFSPLFENSRQYGLENVRAHGGYGSIYPFEQHDLDELACFFDFDFPGKGEMAAYIEPLEKRVHLWKQLWSRSRPPALTFDAIHDGKVAIYDTRPGQKKNRLELTGLAAAAFEACEAICSFETLAADLASKWGHSYPGDAELQHILKYLVDHHLMLHEDGHYLSLAVRPVAASDVSEEW